MKLLVRAVIFALLILIVFGCAMQNSPQKKPQLNNSRGEEQVHINPELMETVKERAETVDAVKDSTAVVVNQNISVAVKVTGFDRLKLKSIRQDVHKKITEINQEYQVHVTTDKKLFSELQKIEKQLQKNPSPAELRQIKIKVDKINEDMKG